MSNEYILRQVTVHPETGATNSIPINTTNAIEIIVDNFDNKEWFLIDILLYKKKGENSFKGILCRRLIAYDIPTSAYSR